MIISIIVASFNNANTIEQCIESVLNQDNKDIELVIVDGGSKDNTQAILEKYKSRITYISEPDNGIYDALNKGIKLSKGDIIGTLGADDFYPTNKILSSVNSTFKETKAEAIYGDIQFVNPDDIKNVTRFWKAKEYQIENWLKGWMPPHLTFFVKRENFEKYGFYLTDFTCAGDYELMLRMLYKHKIKTAYLPSTLVTMRTGGTSSASLKHRYVANMEDRKAWKINNLKPKWYTLWMKPLSKIRQLFIKN